MNGRVISLFLVAALVVVGLLYFQRGRQVDDLGAELASAQNHLRLSRSATSHANELLRACDEVVRDANGQILRLHRQAFRMFDRTVPALTRRMFMLGQKNDKQSLNRTIQALGERASEERMRGRDLRRYGWAPRSAPDEGNANLADVCRRVDGP